MKYKVTTRKPPAQKEVKHIADSGTGAMPGVQQKAGRPKRASTNQVSQVQSTG